MYNVFGSSTNGEGQEPALDIKSAPTKTPAHMLIPHIYAVLYDKVPFEICELPRDQWTPDKNAVREYLSKSRGKETADFVFECSMDVASIEKLMAQHPDFISRSELKAARDIALSIILDELESAISACQESIDFYMADKWAGMVEKCNEKMRELTGEYENIKHMMEKDM